jgi:hypothetical protein
MGTGPAPEVPGVIRYSVQEGSPRLDVTFDVAPDGFAAVQVLTEASLPQGRPVRLGTFAAKLDPAFHDALRGWVPALLQAAREAPQAAAPAPGVLRILSAGSEEPLFVDPFSLPDGFEKGLVATGVASLAVPVAAVEVGADVAGGRLLISGIGTEPFPILLLDESVPGYFARCWRDDPAAPDGMLGLDLAAVRALSVAGEVPAGPALLAPGDSLSLPLPPPPAGGEPQTGGFIFWRTGERGERRIVAGTW